MRLVAAVPAAVALDVFLVASPLAVFTYGDYTSRPIVTRTAMTGTS
jgi:hypothetical protein